MHHMYMKDNVSQSVIYTRGAGGFGWDSWSHLLITTSHTSTYCRLLNCYTFLNLFKCLPKFWYTPNKTKHVHCIVRTLFPAAKLPIIGNITSRAMSSLQWIRSGSKSCSIWRLIYWIASHRYSFHDKHLNYHLKKKKKLVKIYLICRCCGWAL